MGTFDLGYISQKVYSIKQELFQNNKILNNGVHRRWLQSLFMINIFFIT